MSEKKRYTKIDAREVIWYLKKVCGQEVDGIQIIGSLLKKGKSNNDIDLYIPSFHKTHPKNGVSEAQFIEYIAERLDAKKVIKTDWDGFFFKDTHFGNIDLFFSKKGFTY